MPVITRKPIHTIVEARREIFHAVGWQVRSSLWRPPTDVYETEESFIVKVEIAGMREEDIEVAVENNILLVSGNRADTPERKAYYHQMEIQSGKFEIAVELPAPIDVEKAGAEYKDGFLTVNLPKHVTTS